MSLATGSRAFPLVPTRIALAIAAALCLMFVAVAQMARPAVECERKGAFSSAFSHDFDIARVDCQVTAHDSPVAHLYATPPHVEIEWPEGAPL